MTAETIQAIEPRIKGIALSFCRQAHDFGHLDDMVQEGLKRAIVTERKGVVGENILVAAARYGMLDYLRAIDHGQGITRLTRKKLRASGIQPEAMKRVNSSLSPHYDAGIDAEVALNAIPNPIDRKVVEMYFFGGLAMWEIGAQLGVTQGRISQRINRCLTAVRQTLAA